MGAFTGEADVLDWCARRSVIPLVHSRPLWRMDVIPGLPGGRAGVLVVVHYVVADGLRGVAAIAALLDPAPPASPGARPSGGPNRRPPSWSW